MNEELFQAEYRTRMTRALSDEALAREMYEVGKRVERERIVKLLSYISDTTDSYDEFTNQTCDLIRRLKAEPYTEGE